MYLWIGAIFDKNEENKIRKCCKLVNKKFKVSEEAFTLPQHISLKTSFYTENYNEIIEYVKEIMKNQKYIDVELNNIRMLNNSIIWLDVKANRRLRQLHNFLNMELEEKFNIQLNGFDGDKFRFHSTLFQVSQYNERIKDLKEALEKTLRLPINLQLREVDFGISESGGVGTYKVCDKLLLKRLKK